MKKFLSTISDILLRFYAEIIAGVWAVLLVIPLDSFLYELFTGAPSYPLDIHYVIFFACYTTFFFISGALVPVVRKRRIYATLDHLEHTKQITYLQKKKILSTIKDVSSYQSIFSISGFLHFLMENIFSISVMFAYFGIEGVIGNTMTHRTLTVPVIFIILFIALLIVEKFLDDYIAHNTRKKRNNSNANRIYTADKTLMMQLLEDIGGGGSSSEKLGQLLLEDTIDDIAEIMNISKEREAVKRKRKVGGKTGLPKGRLEKAKQGKIFIKKRKKPVMTRKRKSKKNRRVYSNY